MVKRAHEDYGEYFDNAYDLVRLAWGFLENFDKKKYLAFSIYLSLMQNAISLSLLSAIRRHEVQANHMARVFLESTILACYWLKNQRIIEDRNLISDELSEFLLEENHKKQAYIWIEEQYPNHNNNFKKFKGYINKHFSHACPSACRKIVGGNNIINVFDDEDKSNTFAQLYMIGNFTYGSLDLITQVINDSGYKFESSVEFSKKMRHYEKINNLLCMNIENLYKSKLGI